jgi:hypothetical protein
MTEKELLDLQIAVSKEIHTRANYARPQYYKDNPNNHWKLSMNLDALHDMGRLDLYERELARAKAIKEADKKCFKLHGRYVTQEEFERGDFK